VAWEQLSEQERPNTTYLRRWTEYIAATAQCLRSTRTRVEIHLPTLTLVIGTMCSPSRSLRRHEALQARQKKPAAQPTSLLPGPRQAIDDPDRVSKHLPGQHAESERPVGHSSNAIAIAVSESIVCPSFQRAANRGSPNAFRAALN